MPDKIELTKEEIKNGWDVESLSKYLKEREKGQAESIDINNRIVRPDVQVSYSPLRWRD